MDLPSVEKWVAMIHSPAQVPEVGVRGKKKKKHSHLFHLIPSGTRKELKSLHFRVTLPMPLSHPLPKKESQGEGEEEGGTCGWMGTSPYAYSYLNFLSKCNTFFHFTIEKETQMRFINSKF